MWQVVCGIASRVWCGKWSGVGCGVGSGVGYGVLMNETDGSVA